MMNIKEVFDKLVEDRPNFDWELKLKYLVVPLIVGRGVNVTVDISCLKTGPESYRFFTCVTNNKGDNKLNMESSNVFSDIDFWLSSSKDNC